jgi:hypothetical protein
MSPEQAAGRNVTTTSDIFSLGVVAYEMLCRSKPFEGNSYSEVLERIQTYEPPAVTDLNPLIQPDIEDVIARMLEKDEPHRYQSMTDVITDLEHAMEKLQIPRDRRRLLRYITDPDAYEASFRDKVVKRCLSQGSYYMQKGHSHLEEAMLEFKRILYVDPSNERARRNLERIRSERGEKEKTVTLETVAVRSPRKKRAAKASKPKPNARPRRRAARSVFVLAAVLVAVASTGYVAVQRGLLPAPGFLPAPNEPPALSAPNRLVVTAGESVEFRLQAVDAEGDPVAMRAHSLPDGAELSDDGAFAWQPAYGQEGSHRITFQADDGNSAANAVTVIDVQAARLTIDFDPIAPVRMKSGQRMSRTLRAESDSGDPVRFRLAGGPNGMVVEGDQLRWNAPEAVSGEFTATVVASDGHVEAARDVTVTVSPPRPAEASRIGSVEWRLPEKADIYVDGALKKRASDRVKLDLPAGRHTLQAQLESGITGWNQVVDVKGGATETIRARELEYGALSVYFLGSVGEFQINGRTFSHQPPFSAVRVPVGNHPVSCRMAGDEGPKELNVRVEKGKETIIEYEVGREPSVSIEEG